MLLITENELSLRENLIKIKVRFKFGINGKH